MLIIGIAGGSGSGKTTVVKAITEQLKDKVTVIPQDSYYKDLSHFTAQQKRDHNFDHPDSIDFELLCSQLADLKNQNVVFGAHYLQNKEDYDEVVKEFDSNSEKPDFVNMSSEEGKVAALIADPTALDAYIDVNATGFYITPEMRLKQAVSMMTDEERSNYKYLYVKNPEEAAAYFNALYEKMMEEMEDVLG